MGAAKAEHSPIFVVHKHLTSKIHYDLRLEFDGKLKSWTVPRGPSMDPRVKKFAAEDTSLQPLHLASVEGANAAQKVIVWDTGSLEFSGGEKAFKKGLKKGRLTFVLRGKKLHGAFSMFRFVGKKRWLLFKRPDKYATSKEVTADAHSVLSNRMLKDPEVGPKKRKHSLAKR